MNAKNHYYLIMGLESSNVSGGKATNSSYKWIVLAAFTAVAGVSQMLWLNFAPLISQMMDKYDKDEATISLLLLVFPLLYVVLSIPAGAMIDKRGYKFTVGFGSVIMALFALLRIYDGNFYVMLLAQTGIAFGQPFVVNGISKLVADWFEQEEHALATGLGTVGMFVGMALGMGLTPLLANDSDIRLAMTVFAAISIVSALAFILFVREKHKAETLHTSLGIMAEFRLLLKSKELIILFIISFFALGFFNGLITWIEPMLANSGFDAATAGLAGAVIIFGAIAGSIIIPALSDKLRKRKPFLIGCCASGLIICYPLLMTGNYGMLMILGAALGFFFLPGYALLLAMSEEQAGAEKAGVATGLLMLAGNAGGTVVIIAMELVKGGGDSWRVAIYLLMALLVIGIILASMTSETFDRREG